MQQLQLKPYVVRLYLATMLLFIANKFVVRPFILENNFPQLWQVVALSIPNTFEAIVGTLNLAAILVWIKLYFAPRFDRVSAVQLNLFALLIAAIYVLTQEFKLHDLGGRNTYDPNDVVASIVGLLGMAFVLLYFGVSDRS